MVSHGKKYGSLLGWNNGNLIKEVDMKKFSKHVFFVIILALLAVVPAFAKPGFINLKGEVLELDEATLSVTLETHKGETFVVIMPETVDFTLLEVGDTLLVKGEVQEDGTVLADRVMWIGAKNDDGAGDDTGTGDGSKMDGAYCTEGKKENPHPFAAKLVERYGETHEITTEWVMSYFCEGMGMGGIMLAILTSEKSELSPDDILAERNAGRGWGQIWKEMKLIGSEKDGESPPGHLKRPDHAGPKGKKDK